MVVTFVRWLYLVFIKRMYIFKSIVWKIVKLKVVKKLSWIFKLLWCLLCTQLFYSLVAMPTDFAERSFYIVTMGYYKKNKWHRQSLSHSILRKTCSIRFISITCVEKQKQKKNLGILAVIYPLFLIPINILI